MKALPNVQRIKKQRGAILTLEYAVLSTVAGMSAIAAATAISQSMTDMIQLWLSACQTYAEAVFDKMSNGAFSAHETTGLMNVDYAVSDAEWANIG